MINSTPVLLTESRALTPEDSGQTLLYFGDTDIELYLTKATPRGLGCEAVQLGAGFIKFAKGPGEGDEVGLSLYSTFESGIATTGKGSSIHLWWLSTGSYATRVVGAVDAGGGATGPAGPQGEVGPMGPAGPEGPAGAEGPAGPEGPAGAEGATGAASTVPGPQGVQGLPGVQGPAGPAGADSTVAGPQGATGPTGPVGPVGPQGEVGATGATGATGAVGAASTVPGPAGPTAVSADAGNLATLGTDGLLHVPNTSKLMGVTDGTEAAPGTIGEYKVVANQVGVLLPSTVPTQICPLPLEPGDWEIWGSVDFAPAAGVSPNMVAASVSVHPDSLPTEADLLTGVGILNMITTNALTSGQRQMLMTGQCRSNSAAPLTVYLVAQTTLGGQGTLTAKGYICARRAR